MLSLGTVVGTYFLILLLKIFNVPVIKEIEWKWFLIVPFVWLLFKLVWPFIEFAWHFIIGLFILSALAYGGLWVFSL